MRVMFSAPDGSNVVGEVTPPVDWDGVIDVRTDKGIMRVNGWLFGSDDIEILDPELTNDLCALNPAKDITSIKELIERYVAIRQGCERLERFSHSETLNAARERYYRANALRTRLENLHTDIQNLYWQSVTRASLAGHQRMDHRPFEMLTWRIAKLDRRMSILRTEAAMSRMANVAICDTNGTDWFGQTTLAIIAAKLDREQIVDAEVIE